MCINDNDDDDDENEERLRVNIYKYIKTLWLCFVSEHWKCAMKTKKK